MTTEVIRNMDDRGLATLLEIIRAEESRREYLIGSEVAECLSQLTDEQLKVVADIASEEEEERIEREMNLQAAHEIEQGEALPMERAGEDDSIRSRRLSERCARLFKMARLKAPAPIIRYMLDAVIRSMPEESP